MIVLPNGFNVYPEDIENALRIAGIRDSVVLETEPGRIEAIVLASAGGLPGADRGTGSGGVPSPDSRRRSRPPTRPSGRTSGSPAGGCGPSEDFPRTHTLKIKRDPDPRLDRRRRAAGGR